MTTKFPVNQSSFSGATAASAGAVTASARAVTACLGVCAFLTGCTPNLPIASPGVSVQQGPKPTADSYFPLTAGSWWRYRQTVSTNSRETQTWFEVRVLPKGEIPNTVPAGVDKNDAYVVELRDLPNPKQKKWDGVPTKLNKQPPRYTYFAVKDGKVCPLSTDCIEFQEPRPGVPLTPNAGDRWLVGKTEYSVMIFPESKQAVVGADGFKLSSMFDKGVGLSLFQYGHQTSAGRPPDFERADLVDHHIEPD